MIFEGGHMGQAPASEESGRADTDEDHPGHEDDDDAATRVTQAARPTRTHFNIRRSSLLSSPLHDHDVQTSLYSTQVCDLRPSRPPARLRFRRPVGPLRTC
nr:hypothetical protein CFP56_03119 [Quercus suber]